MEAGPAQEAVAPVAAGRCAAAIFECFVEAGQVHDQETLMLSARGPQAPPIFLGRVRLSSSSSSGC